MGDFFSLLGPFTLLTGVYTVVLATLHGTVFLSGKLADDMADRARKTAWRAWLVTVPLAIITIIALDLSTDIVARLGVVPGVVPRYGLDRPASGRLVHPHNHDGWAFASTAVAIAFAIVTVFMTLYPRVMISSLNPDWSLTIYNASSTPYTLSVMTVVALIFVPIVLVYQGWTYYMFRKRITRQSIES